MFYIFLDFIDFSHRRVSSATVYTWNHHVATEPYHNLYDALQNNRPLEYNPIQIEAMLNREMENGCNISQCSSGRDNEYDSFTNKFVDDSCNIFDELRALLSEQNDLEHDTLNVDVTSQTDRNQSNKNELHFEPYVSQNLQNCVEEMSRVFEHNRNEIVDNEQTVSTLEPSTHLPLTQTLQAVDINKTESISSSKYETCSLCQQKEMDNCKPFHQLSVLPEVHPSGILEQHCFAVRETHTLPKTIKHEKRPHSKSSIDEPELQSKCPKLK